LEAPLRKPATTRSSRQSASFLTILPNKHHLLCLLSKPLNLHTILKRPPSRVHAYLSTCKPCFCSPHACAHICSTLVAHFTHNCRQHCGQPFKKPGGPAQPLLTVVQTLVAHFMHNCRQHCGQPFLKPGGSAQPLLTIVQTLVAHVVYNRRKHCGQCAGITDLRGRKFWFSVKTLVQCAGITDLRVRRFRFLVVKVCKGICAHARPTTALWPS